MFYWINFRTKLMHRTNFTLSLSCRPVAMDLCIIWSIYWRMAAIWIAKIQLEIHLYTFVPWIIKKLVRECFYFAVLIVEHSTMQIKRLTRYRKLLLYFYYYCHNIYCDCFFRERTSQILQLFIFILKTLLSFFCCHKNIFYFLLTGKCEIFVIIIGKNN